MRRNTKEMLNDMDYITTLNKADRKWLYKAVSGITNANTDTLSEITTEANAHSMYEPLYGARNAFSRDLMTLGSRVGSGEFSDPESASYLPCIKGEITVNTPEDALIEAIDNERAGRPNNFRSYGNNDFISIGSDVVICVEGHACQNRLGKVIAQRRGQYLVQVPTPKGDISIYLSAHELARVNTMKRAL